MGCMNHISPSENMFKTAPGAKFRGVEKLAWDSWRILMPFRVFSSRHVFIRCLYITYTAGENNVLSRYTTRGNKIIYKTPQGSHRCFAGWILKADVDPGVETHQSIIYTSWNIAWTILFHQIGAIKCAKKTGQQETYLILILIVCSGV